MTSLDKATTYPLNWSSTGHLAIFEPCLVNTAIEKGTISVRGAL